MENIKCLEMIMMGTRLITVSEFYELFDGLQLNSSNKLPLFLYSFNLIDKYAFVNTSESNTIVEIKNITQNTHTRLNIGEYLLNNKFYQKDIFELKSIVDSDLRVEASERELVIYAAGELKETFTVLMDNKLDVECAVKELICESWLACSIKFIQMLNNIKNWNDVNYTINCFSNVYSDIDLEISEQDKENAFKSMYLIVKNMELCPEQGKFGLSLLTEFLKLFFYEKDIDIKIQEEIIYSFIQSQEEMLLKNEESLVEQFYIHVHLEQVYNRIYTVKKSEENNSLEFELLNIRLWDILGNKKFLDYIENRDFETLTLENLYIGQAFGKDGSRNVFDRIGEGHEKLQRIISTVPPDKEVALLFFSMRPKGNLVISQYGIEATEKLKNLLNDNIDPKEYVDLAEIALITYLKPKYNTQHVKDDFKSLKTAKIRDVINSYDGIQIFMDFEKVNWKIISSDCTNEFTSNKPYIHCLFKKDAFNLGMNELEDLFEAYKID
ncbi:hypothetical protein [Streptococcus cristatus]|uniref:hypothetical protein n=1 Tax=Streptococcus cristatus TaxID=45634 RepID=UPI000660B5FF|nr:hypothetical protein [Streptococcus cristatus]